MQAQTIVAPTRALRLLHSCAILLALSTLFVAAGCGGGGGGGGGGGVGEPELAYVANGNAINRLALDDDASLYVHDGYDMNGAGTPWALAISADRRFAYSVSGDRVYSFSIESGSGSLTPINDLAAGVSPRGIVLHPARGVLYVNDRDADQIRTYTVDPADGSLSFLSSVPCGDCRWIELHPWGNHLYAINEAFLQVSRHAINGDGSLGSGVVVRTEPTWNPSALAFHPSGNTAYLAIETSSSNVRVLDVDVDGNFTLIDTVSSGGSNPRELRVDPAGTYLYAGNDGNSSISKLMIDPTDETLTPQGTTGTVDGPTIIKISPTGENLLVGSANDREVDIFSVGANGSLTRLQRSYVQSNVRGIAFRNRMGVVAKPRQQVFVPHPSDGRVYRFDRNETTGDLVNRWEVAAGMGPMHVTFHPNGKFAYVPNDDSGEIEVYSFDTGSGNLTSLQIVSIYPNVPNDGTDQMTRIEIDPSGRHLYALDNRAGLGQNGRILRYAIADDGMISYTGLETTADNPENLILDPTGRFAYVLASYGDAIQTYQVSASSGDLNQTNFYSGIDRPLHGTIHPNGRWLYVAVENEDSVEKYLLDENNGSPTNNASYTWTGANDTKHVAVHPNGKFLYATDQTGVVARFTIDQQTGGLTFVETVDAPGTYWFEITADGKHAYAIDSDGILRFEIDAATGAITYLGETELTGLGTYQRSLTVH